MAIPFDPNAEQASEQPATPPTGFECAWEGCDQSFDGDMPPGWAHVLAYWTPQSDKHVRKIPPGGIVRDDCLCPEHMQMLSDCMKRAQSTQAGLATEAAA